jgi:hypothetical protein
MPAFFALDASEKRLGQVRVHASIRQVDGLLEWARQWPERTWAIEGAGGLGHLLAQQPIGVGEKVFDVQPKLDPAPSHEAKHRPMNSSSTTRCRRPVSHPAPSDRTSHDVPCV